MQCNLCGSEIADVSDLARRTAALLESPSDDVDGCPACGAKEAQPGDRHPRRSEEPPAPLPAVRPVSVARYFGLIFILPLFATALGWASIGGVEGTPTLTLATVAVVLAGLITQCVLLYKAWAALQDDYAPTSPGRAVGLLFVPFINIFWMFIAFGGWGHSYNAFAERHDVRGFRASPELFMAWAAAEVASCAGELFLPALFWLGAIATLFIAPFGVIQMCRGVNHVARAGADRELPAARALR